MSESTAFEVKYDNGGLRISWGDDPLSFIWQSPEQVCDLCMRLHRESLTMATELARLVRNVETDDVR